MCWGASKQSLMRQWWRVTSRVGRSMVFVQRDQQGRLLRVEEQPFEGMDGSLSEQCPELHSWLEARLEVKRKLDELNASDREVVRVFEDVINLLVEQGVIRYKDLPEPARRKLDQRALVRAEIEGLVDHPPLY